MKILFLNPESDLKSGAEKSISILIRQLAQNQEHEVHLFTPLPGALSETLKGFVKFHSISGFDFSKIRRDKNILSNMAVICSFLTPFFRFVEYIRQEHFEILHSNGIKTHLLLFFVSMFYRKAKIVWHVRDIFELLLHKLIFSILSYSADRIILVSQACKQNFLYRSDTRFSVVANAVDFTIIDNEVHTSIQKGKEVLFSVIGRISRQKGQKEAVSLMEVLLKAGINCKLRIIGTCNEEKGYFTELLEHICQKKLENLVDFIGHVDNIEPYYLETDVVLVLSPMPDPLPRVVYEAFYFKKPVFSFNSGGIREIYQVNGQRYLSDGDIEITALQIKDYLNNPSLYYHDIEYHYHYVKTELSPAIHMQRIENIYTEILSKM